MWRRWTSGGRAGMHEPKHGGTHPANRQSKCHISHIDVAWVN